MKYGRFDGNTVIEVFTPPNGVSINDCFVPEIASQFVEVPDQVEANWTLVDDVWSAPPPAPPLPVPTPTKLVTADEFRAKLLFLEKIKWDNPDDQATAEKVTIKTVKNDFAVTGTLDFLLQSTVDEIDALETVGVLGAGRAAEIISELTA